MTAQFDYSARDDFLPAGPVSPEEIHPSISMEDAADFADSPGHADHAMARQAGDTLAEMGMRADDAEAPRGSGRGA